MRPWWAARFAWLVIAGLSARSELTELTAQHAVVVGGTVGGRGDDPGDAACISHHTGAVLVWQREDNHLISRGRRVAVTVAYHPHSSPHSRVDGHPEYWPISANRKIVLRTAPAEAFSERRTSGPPPHARWRDDVDGGVIAGTFTMGAGTTASRPHFDQYRSTWHGMLEPLLDLWAHLRRLGATVTSSSSTRAGHGPEGGPRGKPLRCPRYETILTDEVLGRKAEWKDGYLVRPSRTTYLWYTASS